MNRIPWILSLLLAGLLVADHSRSTLSWVLGYEAGLQDAAVSAHWFAQHPQVTAPLASVYLRLEGGSR